MIGRQQQQRLVGLASAHCLINNGNFLNIECLFTSSKYDIQTYTVYNLVHYKYWTNHCQLYKYYCCQWASFQAIVVGYENSEHIGTL